MFCLKQPKDSSISYYNLNRGSVTDTEMEQMLGTCYCSVDTIKAIVIGSL